MQDNLRHSETADLFFTNWTYIEPHVSKKSNQNLKIKRQLWCGEHYMATTHLPWTLSM